MGTAASPIGPYADLFRITRPILGRFGPPQPDGTLKQAIEEAFAKEGKRELAASPDGADAVLLVEGLYLPDRSNGGGVPPAAPACPTADEKHGFRAACMAVELPAAALEKKPFDGPSLLAAFTWRERPISGPRAAASCRHRRKSSCSNTSRKNPIRARPAALVRGAAPPRLAGRHLAKRRPGASHPEGRRGGIAPTGAGRLLAPGRAAGDPRGRVAGFGPGHRVRKEVYERAARYLQELAEPSGGRCFPAGTLEGIRAAFAQVAGELRRQYTLLYYPARPAGDGAFRSIRVAVDIPSARVRSRKGYRLGGAPARQPSAAQGR